MKHHQVLQIPLVSVLSYSLQLIMNETFLLCLKKAFNLCSYPVWAFCPVQSTLFWALWKISQIRLRKKKFLLPSWKKYKLSLSIKVAMNLILVIADRLHCCPSLVAFLRKWCIMVQRTCSTKMMFCLNRNVAFVKCSQLNFLILLTWYKKTWPKNYSLVGSS